VDVVLKTGAAPAEFTLVYRTHEDPRGRALPLERLLLPWAELEKAAAPGAREIPETRGGNWVRGRDLFFGDAAACGKCHAVGGRGGAIGPDLSNLPHRDYASVVRDIAEPSFAINPDYVTNIVALADGRVLTGVVRTEGDRLHIAGGDGAVVTVRREQVERMKPSSLSVMPEGIPKALGPEKLRDLMTFLLTDPPRMPEYGKGSPPPARSREEVQAVLAGAPPGDAKPRPLRVVLVAGPKDHGPGEHDYPAWQSAWGRLLGMAEGVRVGAATGWPSAADLASADVLVFYQRGAWAADRARDIDAFLARGGGLVYLHYAVDGGADAPGFARRIGLAWQGGRSKFRHGPLELAFGRVDHPIARNFDTVKFHDESYWNLVGEAGAVRPLATAVEDGERRPLLWTLEPPAGRVFVSILGHYSWTFDDPLFRVLLLRAICWTAKEPVDRLNDLVFPGARISE
jgi:putative heme-binding domain-containing protein